MTPAPGVVDVEKGQQALRLLKMLWLIRSGTDCADGIHDFFGHEVWQDVRELLASEVPGTKR